MWRDRSANACWLTTFSLYKHKQEQSTGADTASTNNNNNAISATNNTNVTNTAREASDGADSPIDDTTTHIYDTTATSYNNNTSAEVTPDPDTRRRLMLEATIKRLGASSDQLTEEKKHV